MTSLQGFLDTRLALLIGMRDAGYEAKRDVHAAGLGAGPTVSGLKRNAVLLERGALYRPANTGLRFSTKALAASRWSSVRPEREWLRASMSSVSESEAVTAPLSVCFM